VPHGRRLTALAVARAAVVRATTGVPRAVRSRLATRNTVRETGPDWDFPPGCVPIGMPLPGKYRLSALAKAETRYSVRDAFPGALPPEAKAHPEGDS